MQNFKWLPIFVLSFIISSNTTVIVSKNKYAGITPCESNDDCEHLVNSKCEDSICVCNGSKFCEDITKRVVTKVGESCSEDDECNIENSMCTNEKKCACNPGYAISTNARRCLMISEGINGTCEDSVQCYTKVAHSSCQGNKCICEDTHEYNGSCYKNVGLGENCKDIGECTFTDFAECKNSKCACIENYVENTKRSKCLPAANGLHSSCIDNAQCRKQLGGSSDCNNGICECKELYQFKNTTKKCVRDILLGEICERHSDCHGPLPGVSRLECILGVCKCKIFYNEMDGYCIISSAQTLKISLLVTVMYLMYILLSIIDFL